jgi:hypothetical protein
MAGFLESLRQFNEGRGPKVPGRPGGKNRRAAEILKHTLDNSSKAEDIEVNASVIVANITTQYQ